VLLWIDDTNLDIKSPVFHVSDDIPGVIDRHLTNTQTIYFSFVTAATIGYGDVSSGNDFVMKLV
jgi:hypothetical protein